MSDKTIEELKAELDMLRKDNLEREISLEKKKIEEAKKAEEEKQNAMLRESIRNEVYAELKGSSVITEEKEKETPHENKPGTFGYDEIAKRLGFKLYDYKTLTRKISTGGYKED
jgi:hypothetical protein